MVVKMKKLMVLLLIFLSILVYLPLNNARADVITNIYSFNAVNTMIDIKPVTPFDTDLGILEEVNISVRGFIQGVTYNPFFPYDFPNFVLNVSHDFMNLGPGMLDFVLPAQKLYPTVVVEPVQVIPTSLVDLNISIDQNFPIPIVSSVGYHIPPTIDVELEDFTDDVATFPPNLMFRQTITVHPAFARVISNLFMQVDYTYSPQSSGGPSVIGPIGPVQLDPITNNLFPGIASIQEISDVQLYAMAAASIPEPATMLLLGTALIGLAGLRRRFKK